MKQLFLLGFGILTGIPALAQFLSVNDKESSQPLMGATVISEQPEAIATTNAQGLVDISAFKISYSLSIYLQGYQTIHTDYEKLELENFKIQMIPTALQLDHVVISANKWTQANQNSLSAISTLTARDALLHQPQTAADLLGVSGKVFIQKSQQGGGSPMIRGFATNRLLNTVDGVRMNTAIFRAGNIQNVININPFATENTEILFGPGSLMYGSDAIGGVMSFQTLTPQFSSKDNPLITGKAVARYSSANKEKTGHFDVNLGWKKWALVTSLSSWDFDHLRQGNNGPEDYLKKVFVQRQDSTDVVITQQDPLLQIPTAYSQINLMQKIRYKPTPKWDFQYGYHYSNTSPYGRYDRHNRFRNGLPRYSEWDYGPQKWQMHNLSVEHRGNNILYDMLTARIAYQRFEESRIDRSLNSAERNTQTEKVKAWSTNLDFFKRSGNQNKIYYGLEWVQNNVLSFGQLTDITTGYSTTGPSRYPMADWNSIAAYVSDQYDIGKSVTLQAGLRYNYYHLKANFAHNLNFYPFPFSHTTFGNASLTGSLGTTWRPDKNWVIRAAFSTAFRSPNVDDMGKVFDSEPGTVTVPNPNLEAEYAYNFDMGIAKVIGEVVKLDVSGYYTLLQNALVRRNFQLNGQDSIVYDGNLSQVQAVQNAAVAKVYGLQAGMEIKLPAGFRVLSDFNWQRGKEELDDGTISTSRHAAPLFGVSRIRYQHKNLTLELNSTYQGMRSFKELPQEEQRKDELYAKDENGQNYSPSYYTLNLRALYAFTPTINFSAGMENITDQRYRPYSSGLSGAGRNFMLSLQVTF